MIRRDLVERQLAGQDHPLARRAGGRTRCRAARSASSASRRGRAAPGASAAISRARPRSCTITASTRAAAMARTNSTACGNSSEKISVLNVDVPADAVVVQVLASSRGSSSSVKFVGPMAGVEIRQAEVDRVRPVGDRRPQRPRHPPPVTAILVAKRVP